MAKKPGLWLAVDICNSDYMRDEDVEQGWPADNFRKSIEMTDIQRAHFAEALKAGAALGMEG